MKPIVTKRKITFVFFCVKEAIKLPKGKDEIGRDLDLKRPRTVNRNKVRKMSLKAILMVTIPIFLQAFLNQYSTLIHSLSTNIDGFDFNKTAQSNTPASIQITFKNLSDPVQLRQRNLKFSHKFKPTANICSHESNLLLRTYFALIGKTLL